MISRRGLMLASVAAALGTPYRSIAQLHDKKMPRIGYLSVATAERDKKLLAQHPLIQDGQKLIPSVTRVFRKDQNMYVYVEAYEPSAETTQPLMASVSFYRGKVKAFETEPLQVTEGLNPKTKALPLKFSVPLAKLPPGRYTCQVSVLDPTAQKFAFWRAPMVLLP